MKRWFSVSVEGKPKRRVTRTQIDKAAAALEGFSPAIGFGPQLVSGQISLEASSVDAAIARGFELLLEALPPLDFEKAEVWTEERLERDVMTPNFPELVGALEAAELLGVSRQRVGQLAANRTDFPPPIVHLAAGPVWLTSSIRGFARTWSRKPGRPAKSQPAIASSSGA